MEGGRKAAKEFFRKDVKNVIITPGVRGAYFNGGLLAGLSQEMGLLSAARYGNVVANLAVTKLGTAASMPLQEEINDFMRRENIVI